MNNKLHQWRKTCPTFYKFHQFHGFFLSLYRESW